MKKFLRLFNEGRSANGARESGVESHASYYELFRAFNSEGTFLDFARQLKADSSYRPGALKRLA